MKRVSGILFLCLSILLWGRLASAVPLDLSTFTAQDGVSENGGVVSFQEDMTYAAWYYYDDFFMVPDDATVLSFDYDFALGQDDYDDYLVFELDYFAELEVDTNTTGGHFEIDLSPFQSNEVSLAWGLVWGGDFDAGTTASVYNIDLATAGGGTPVPEPCTMLLVGTGLVAGLFGLERKKLFKRS